MISLHYTSHTKAYNTIYAACNIVEAIYSFTVQIEIIAMTGSLFIYIVIGHSDTNMTSSI